MALRLLQHQPRHQRQLGECAAGVTFATIMTHGVIKILQIVSTIAKGSGDKVLECVVGVVAVGLVITMMHGAIKMGTTAEVAVGNGVTSCSMQVL